MDKNYKQNSVGSYMFFRHAYPCVPDSVFSVKQVFPFPNLF